MRSHLILAPCLAVLVAAAAAPAAQAKSVSCSSPSSVTVLFWPTGHPVVNGVGFPKIPTPHLEVYRSGASYLSSDFLLYGDYKGGVDSSRSNCHSAAAGSATLAHRKSTTKRKAIVCSGYADADVVLQTDRSKNKLRVRGRAGATRLFDITLRKHTRKSGSTAAYDGSLCRLTATPR